MLLYLSSEDELSVLGNLDAKSCGFRCGMDTSACRIPDVKGVVVYRLWRLVYQDLCRPSVPDSSGIGSKAEIWVAGTWGFAAG